MSSPVRAASEPGETTLRVVVFPYISFAPLYIAKQAGFFEQQGLHVEFVDFRDHSASIPAVLTGQLDVGSIFTVGLLNAIARGQPMRIVAGKGLASPEHCAANGFMARPDLADELADPDPAFLRSLTFGVDPLWLDSYFLDRALDRWGLGIDDVTTKYIPNPAARMEALTSGSLDIAFFSEPFLSSTRERGIGQMWLTVADIVPGFPFGVITYGPSLLSPQTDEALGKRFLDAYLQGIARLDEGRTPRNVETLAHATGLEPATLRRVCWPTFDPTGRIDAEAVSDYSKWAKARGFADQALPPGAFWEPSFVDALDR